MPTVGERLVHTGGYGDTMRAVPTEFGPLSALICAENTNPLVALHHDRSEPPHPCRQLAEPLPHQRRPHARSGCRSIRGRFAQMSKAFVISSCGTVDEDTIAKLQVGPEGEAFLRNPDCCGGSVIVGPNQQVLAGPMGAEEGIIYADCNLEMNVAAKLRHDFVGHSGRPDIFRLWVNESRPRLYNPFTSEDASNSPREGRWVAPSSASPAEVEPDCDRSLP